MDLSFLKDVKLEPVVKQSTKKPSVVKLPTEADLRVFANGRVYPSEEFAKRAGLEYVPRTITPVEGKKDLVEIHGNGIEIFSSVDWGMVMGKLPQEVVFCAIVPKSLAKVDMWSSTKYDEDNQPKASVLTQGANTFAKERLVPMLATIYGVDWDVTEYVDLTVVTDNVLTSPNGQYHLPKLVMSGDNKGKADYIRREDLTVNPLVISHTEPKAPVDAASKEVPTAGLFAGISETDNKQEVVDSFEELGS